MNQDPDSEIQFDTQGPVATLTINRPRKLNTLTPAMGKRMMALAGEINARKDLRVLVLKGSGERAFSAGSDVSVLDEYGSNWDLRNRTDYVRAVYAIRKPVIALIQGYCIGGGLELALAADLRVAAPEAKFGCGEIKLGWMGGCGNTQLLPRLIGYGKAMQMTLTGDMIGVDEAYRLGLVQEVWAPEDIAVKTQELANRIASNAPIAVELTKHLLRISESTPIPVGLDYENDMFTYCFTTRDHEEGIAAFREKRKPQFRGE
jgi:enoyl-CoA hydratase/carnithine racemase